MNHMIILIFVVMSAFFLFKSKAMKQKKANTATTVPTQSISKAFMQCYYVRKIPNVRVSIMIARNMGIIYVLVRYRKKQVVVGLWFIRKVSICNKYIP